MRDIVDRAVANLIEATGLNVKWEEGVYGDGKLIITIEGKEIELYTEVKEHFRHHQVEVILRKHKPDLIITKKVYAKEKELLRAEHIGYIEENGNLEIKKNGLFLLIEKKETNKPNREQGNRAFTKTGLKVIFQLLQNPHLINTTQREIAKRAKVALGNIPMIITGLMETGFLIKKNKKEYVWEDKRALLKRWITGYEVTLKPQLFIGQFKQQTNWEDIQLDYPKTLWGGEQAADKLTNYLRPEKYIIYTQENRNVLINKYRIRPDNNGETKIYRQFWKQEEIIETVPPILVYTDLILEGGKRNLETAQMIYNEYIEASL